MQLSQADVVTLVATASGAFLGSVFAFGLELSRQYRSDRNAHRSALLQSQFALSMQRNTLISIRDQYLNPQRNSLQRAFLLIPFQMQSHDMFVDMAEIAFMASADVGPLQSVHVAQNAYTNALGVLHARNQMYLEVSSSPDVEIKSYDDASGEWDAAIDPRRARALRDITDGLYRSFDVAIDLQSVAIDSLGAVVGRL